MTDEEKVVGDNIKNHLEGLNAALKDAHRLGLKVSAKCDDGTIMYSPQPARVHVRVWREFVIIGETRQR